MNDLDALIAEHYRPWRCMVWWNADAICLKLGPITVIAYRWLYGYWRVSWTWFCGEEYIMWPPIESEA